MGRARSPNRRRSRRQGSARGVELARSGGIDLALRPLRSDSVAQYLNRRRLRARLSLGGSKQGAVLVGHSGPGEPWVAEPWNVNIDAQAVGAFRARVATATADVGVKMLRVSSMPTIHEPAPEHAALLAQARPRRLAHTGSPAKARGGQSAHARTEGARRADRLLLARVRVRSNPHAEQPSRGLTPRGRGDGLVRASSTDAPHAHAGSRRMSCAAPTRRRWPPHSAAAPCAVSMCVVRLSTIVVKVNMTASRVLTDATMSADM
mmetsp:Transcript_12039/g.38094  ORF Transcript_12039/g.38094 Transcript_12039/m.38094 type:complete len:263 (+) Transcript_12039:653-1441(+)